MKLFKTEDYVKMQNPEPASRIGGDSNARTPREKSWRNVRTPGSGSQVPYHYHNHRESIIIVISGEATEIIEGKEIPSRP